MMIWVEVSSFMMLGFLQNMGIRVLMGCSLVAVQYANSDIRDVGPLCLCLTSLSEKLPPS